MKPVENNVIEQESIQERNLELFLKNFPGVVSTGDDGDLVINTDKLKLALDPKARIEENGYELNWVGKKEAYHQAYVKQAKILQPLAEDSKLNDGSDFLADSTENILIKGDNLEALKLLKASYFEQVKMIYIDPPYNTKSENFIYRDNFTNSEEAILDELGYSPEYKDYIENIQGARTHSGWLSFIFPRLLLARDLLKEDGVIFISIDDNEQVNLKLLCDEVFGEQNFVATIPWKKRTAKSDVPFKVSQDYDWIICYAKERFKAGLRHERSYIYTSDYAEDGWRLSDLTTQRSESERENSAFTMVDPKTGKKYPHNPNRVWGVTKVTFQKYYDLGKIVFPDDYDFLKISGPAYRVFESEDKEKSLAQNGTEFSVKSISTDLPDIVGMNETGNKEVVELFGSKVFSFPKPTTLIKHLINVSNDTNGIILDFFAGSGTTGQAVMDLNAEDGGNRKFILVQLPEAIDAKKQASAFEFVTEKLGKTEATIFEITAERLRLAGDKILNAQLAMLNDDKDPALNIQNSKLSLDIGFKAFEIADDPMQQFYKPLHEVTPEDLKQLEIALSEESQVANLDTILVNLLLAEKLPLSTPIQTLQDQTLYQAANVLLIVNATDMTSIKQTLSRSHVECGSDAEDSTGRSKVEYISVYSPNITHNTRDQFNQELIPALKQMGLDDSRLRFRG